MSTVRAEKRLLTSERLRLREARASEWKKQGKRQLTPDPPKRELNPDQQAMRTVLIEDFFGNRELMGPYVGLGSGGLAKYVQTGESSPDYDLMKRTAEAVGLSVDQLRSLVRGPIYISSEDDWLDPAEMSAEDRLKLANQFTSLEPESDPADDLDDV